MSVLDCAEGSVCVQSTCVQTDEAVANLGGSSGCAIGLRQSRDAPSSGLGLLVSAALLLGRVRRSARAGLETRVATMSIT